MFRFVRWLFLVTVIAGLAAFVVATRIRGRTPAEGFCSLLDNPECSRLAAQGESLVKVVLRRLDRTPQLRAARREVREIPRALHGAPTARGESNEADGPPLDRHTPGERKALSNLLLEHGSR